MGGFFDFVGDLGGAFVDTVGALPSMMIDVATELPNLVKNQSLNEFAQAVGKDVVGHTATAVEGLFGPKGVIGAPIGLLPEQVRQPVRTVLTPFNAADEWLYHNAISRPLTTLMTAGSYMTEDGQYHRGGWGGLFDPSNWRDAWKVSESRTIGQAVFLAATTKNIEDQAEVSKASGSQAYSMMSGAFDMVTRLFDDPANVVFGYTVGLKAPLPLAKRPGIADDFITGLGKPVRTAKTAAAKITGQPLPERVPASNAFAHAARVGEWQNSPRMAALEETVQGWRKTAADEGLSPSMQRRYVSGKFVMIADVASHPQASFLADLVGSTRTGEELRLALGAVAGDGRSLAALNDLNPIAGGKIADGYLQWGNRDHLRGTLEGSIRDETIANDLAGRGAGHVQQVLDYNAETKSLDLLATEIRPPGATARWQDSIQSSEWYRDSRAGKLIQVVRKGSASPHTIAIDMEGSHNQFASYIRASRAFDPTAEATLIGRYISGNAFERNALIDHVDGLVVDHYADLYKVPRRDVLEMQHLRKSARERQTDQLAQADRQRGSHYATEGRDVRVTEDDRIVASPLFSNQKVQRAPLQDWREVRKALSFWSRHVANHPNLNMSIAEMHSFLDSSMSLWKRGAVARVATGLRIGTELQTRRLSQMTALGSFTDYLLDTAGGVRDLSVHFLDSMMGLNNPRKLLANEGIASEVSAIQKAAKAGEIRVGEWSARPLTVSQHADPYANLSPDTVRLFRGEAPGRPRHPSTKPVPGLLGEAGPDFTGSYEQARQIAGDRGVVYAVDVPLSAQNQWAVSGDESLAAIQRAQQAGERVPPSVGIVAPPSEHIAGQLITDKEALAQVVRNQRRWTRAAIVGGAGGLVFGPLGAAVGAAAGAGLGKVVAGMGDTGASHFITDGRDLGPIFGDTASLREHNAAQISSMNGSHNWLNSRADEAFESMQNAGVHEIISPDSPLWATRWEHYVNNVIGQDPVGRLILQGLTPEQVVARLQGKAGKALIRDQFIRSRIKDPSPEQIADWVDAMFAETHGLTNGLNPEITRAALSGAAKARAWDDIINRGEANLKPSVAGELVSQAFGQGVAYRALAGVLDRVIKFTSRLPEDDLARVPHFKAHHRAEMHRQLDNLRDANGKLPAYLAEADFNRMTAIARRVAVKRTNDIMFDLADRSELSNILRNWVPFFGASHEVVSTWVGIAHDNPAFANKLRLAWHGLKEELPQQGDDPTQDPGPIFATTDQDGRTVIRMRIPAFARWLVGHSMFDKAFDDQGYISMDPRTVNLVTSGGLGFGPIVNIAASKLAIEKPDLEDSLKFILPYGPSRSIKDSLSPTWARRLSSLNAGDEDRAYATNKARIIATRLVKMQHGEAPMLDLSDPKARADFLSDVDNEAQAVAKLRTAVSALSPFAVSFSSPYQPYMDAYSKLIEADPKTADEKFIDNFHEEFFALTQHVTRNIAGLPASIQSVKDQEKFSDLIAAYPEMGSVISGQDGGGSLAKFSSAAYNHQLQSETSPGSGVFLRQRLTPEELVTESDRRLGWNTYTRFMDGIDAALAERGLHSITQKEARDILAKKQMGIAKLAQAHPAWMADYLAGDEGANDRRVAALTAIADDPRMAGRDDLRGMADYASVRDKIIALLAARRDAGGSGVMTAQSNADVAVAWDAIVNALRERNPAFAELHARWLTRDLPAVPITVERKTA